MSLTVTHWKIVDGKKVITKTVSSNKAHTLPENTPAQTPAHPPTEDTGPQVSNPFIDKISLVLNPSSEAVGHDTYNSIIESLNDPKAFIDAGKKAKWGPYKLAKRIVIPSVENPKKYPLLQCAYTGKVVTQLRLEFVPVDLGTEGMFHLHVAVMGFVDNGWHSFAKHARVTRIDVTVDVRGVRMDEFLFLPQQGVTNGNWKANGELETLQFGKKKNKQTLIYNRKAKRLAMNQDWDGKTVIRVERKINLGNNFKLTALPTLPNPFAKMMMVQNMPAAPDAKKAWEWSMFEDSVQVRGLTAALALLPEERRTKYRKHLSAHPQPWWNPDAIWANWPTMLNELNIASPEAWL